MNTETTQHESEIRGQIEASRERISELTGELRSIDSGLDDLADERIQFAQLHEACTALEKLDAHDGTELFWNGLATADSGRDHVTSVRERVHEFETRITQIEASRQAILRKIRHEEDTGEFLEDDLYELQRLEEERKNEWVLEREIDDSPDRPAIMPWSRSGEDDARFRRTLAVALLLCISLGIVFPLIPLPTPERWEVAELPDRLTQLVREQRIPPPPVQERARPEEHEPEPIEEKLLAEEGTPKPTETATQPKPGAGAKGILAFRDKFTSLANANAPALGSQARISDPGVQKTGRATRSLVTTAGPGSSGGIDLSSLSRDVGGGNGQGLEGVQVARATSSIGAIGGNSDRPLSGGPGSSRTDEEIQIVFDRHKAALYRMYNRELRNDPTLQGQMVLRLTIEADGSVSLCELKSSDMNAPRLASQVVDRVKTFDFGAKDGIPAITILYPIDFLPAS